MIEHKNRLKREIRKYLKTKVKTKHTFLDAAKVLLNDVNSNKHLNLKRRKISNTNLTLHLKEIKN